MKQLLAGAVLIGAAAWFGRTKQERDVLFEEIGQHVPDYIDQMSNIKYATLVCERTAKFMEAMRDEHIYGYVNVEERGKLYRGGYSPCAIDIRQGISRAEKLKNDLTSLTRHRRFHPFTTKTKAGVFHWCSYNDLEKILGQAFTGNDQADAASAPKRVDNAMRNLLQAQKLMKECPAMWDESQGFSWAFSPKDAMQELYSDREMSVGGKKKGMRYI